MTVFNHSNVAQSKLTSFSSTMNNPILQQKFNHVSLNCVDFAIMREQLVDTPLENINSYNKNFFWGEDFTRRSDVKCFVDDELNLNEDLLYAINVNAAGNINHHAYFVS
jgi:hypothetical protein